MGGASSYPRTTGRPENRKQAQELVKRLQELLGQGDLEGAHIDDIVRLANCIDWSLLPDSLRRQLLAFLHEFRFRHRQRLTARRRAKERDESKRQQLSTFIESVLEDNERLHKLELAAQVATVLSCGLKDTRPYHEKLNGSGYYDFKEYTKTTGERYYLDPQGVFIVDRYLDKAVPPCVNPADRYASDKERQALEEVVDNLANLPAATRQAIEWGWLNGDVFDSGGNFSDLKDINVCINLLDEQGVALGSYSDLGGSAYKEMREAGYQREHIPPISAFYDVDKLHDQRRDQVPLREGLGDYSHDNALCFMIFDGQTQGLEHRIATDGAKAFARELGGAEATLRDWLDKSVEWNTKIIESRMMREEMPPLTSACRSALRQQALKTAYALRNVVAAHFVGVGANLDTPLGNRIAGPPKISAARRLETNEIDEE